MKTKFLFGLLAISVSNAYATQISLSAAESLALQQDPAAAIYMAEQAKLQAEGIANSQLPDPMLKLGLGNVPIENFRLNQDPMTQLSVGIGQQFSRGDILTLKAQGFGTQGDRSEQLSDNRQLALRLQIRELWFDILFAETAQSLIRQNKRLFAQNVENLQSQFELGYKQSQDVIQAELELGKFDDKIAAFAQQEQALRGRLAASLGSHAFSEFDYQLPQWLESQEYAGKNLKQHYSLLLNHPQVLAAQKAVDFADNQIAIANQAYKPAFKVELGYGHRRAPDMDGSARSDLLSGFVTMDLPLFTDKRQDQSLAAAEYGKGMKKAEKDLLLNKFNGILNGAIANYLNTQQRMQRYQQTLLKQTKQNTESSLQGYQANTTDFDQVIKGFMDELALELEYQQLHFQSMKSLARIRYFQAL